MALDIGYWVFSLPVYNVPQASSLLYLFFYSMHFAMSPSNEMLQPNKLLQIASLSNIALIENFLSQLLYFQQRDSNLSTADSCQFFPSYYHPYRSWQNSNYSLQKMWGIGKGLWGIKSRSSIADFAKCDENFLNTLYHRHLYVFNGPTLTSFSFIFVFL